MFASKMHLLNLNDRILLFCIEQEAHEEMKQRVLADMAREAMKRERRFLFRCCGYRLSKSKERRPIGNCGNSLWLQVGCSARDGFCASHAAQYADRNLLNERELHVIENVLPSALKVGTNKAVEFANLRMQVRHRNVLAWFQ